MYRFSLIIFLVLNLSCAHDSYSNAHNDQELRSKLVKRAQKYMGIPYQYNGKFPSTGFDCSGFVSYIYEYFGWDISGGSKDLAKLGENKSLNKVELGDLLFFGEKKRGRFFITHVGIVSHIDDKEIEMIHSSYSVGISKQILNRSPYWKKKFLFAKDIINI